MYSMLFKKRERNKEISSINTIAKKTMLRFHPSLGQTIQIPISIPLHFGPRLHFIQSVKAPINNDFPRKFLTKFHLFIFLRNLPRNFTNTRKQYSAEKIGAKHK